MIGESKIDEELASKELLIKSESFFDVESSQKISLNSETDIGLNNEFALNTLKDHNEKIIRNYDQIQVFPQLNMDRANSQYFYLTTTASSSDQILDHNNPAFPIKEFEDFKKPKNDFNQDTNDIQAFENDKNLINLKIAKLNSIIKEDKEKRKVIVEWINNNEWSCKQWSCKKFGKEGAAKRAIQFLEKIHGTTIACLPDGFYSTLLEIGSIECGKSSYSRRKSINCTSGTTCKRKTKVVNQSVEEQKFCPSITSSSLTSNSSSSFKLNQSSNSHELETINLIQRIMILFSSLDSNIFEFEENNKSTQLKKYDSNHQPEWEKLHSNCRKQLRKLVLNKTKNKKFSLEEYHLLLKHSFQMLGVNQAEGNNEYQSVNREIFDSIIGLKTFKDVLYKTVRNDLQLYYSIKDIIQIINLTEKEKQVQVNNQSNEKILNYWDKVIENSSRINDDLQYLSEGGLAGYSSIACSNYGNGFFQFNTGTHSNSSTSPNSETNFKFNSIINHKKSCMNFVHEDIQENGYKSVYPNCNEKRRVATRLQGKVQNTDNCELSNISSSKFLESNSTIQDSYRNNDDYIETPMGGKKCMQMSNAIYTLLDLKYGIQSGKSKEILCDILGSSNLFCVENNIKNDNNIENQSQVLEKKIRKRRSTNDTGNAYKVQKLDQRKEELQNSKIGWWKKPRGWKVTYFKQGQKHSQIFRVSLNSTSIERETQYKLAYSFYLSTQQDSKEEPQTNDENNNTVNINNHFNIENCGNNLSNVTDQMSTYNFFNGIPNIFNTTNFMQMFNTRCVTSNNIPIIGNILPLNYCLAPLFGGCSPPLYGTGVNNPSNIQNDQGYNHISMENHAGVYSSAQIPYQTYPTFVQSIYPLLMPIFPPIVQNSANFNTEWNDPTIVSKESVLNINKINNINE